MLVVITLKNHHCGYGGIFRHLQLAIWMPDTSVRAENARIYQKTEFGRELQKGKSPQF